MACRIADTTCKTEAETKTWTFDYSRFLARCWAPGTYFAEGVAIRPRTPTGFEYVSSGGHSGAREPRWSEIGDGEDLDDGSITWTAQPVSNDSLVSTIASSQWSAEVGISVGTDGLVNTNGVQQATAQISGGTLAASYEVTNLVTLANGAVEESILVVDIQ
jgi:hypothetical protein